VWKLQGFLLKELLHDTGSTVCEILHKLLYWIFQPVCNFNKTFKTCFIGQLCKSDNRLFVIRTQSWFKNKTELLAQATQSWFKNKTELLAQATTPLGVPMQQYTLHNRVVPPQCKCQAWIKEERDGKSLCCYKLS
jgi:hypothetical protein